MLNPTKPKNRITRRTLAKFAFASAVVVPGARIASLKLKDNPLPKIDQPNLIIEGGWILDAQDISNAEASN